MLTVDLDLLRVLLKQINSELQSLHYRINGLEAEAKKVDNRLDEVQKMIEKLALDQSALKA